MSVYQPLEKYLKSQSFGEIPMSFAEIARILGRALPKSAYDHRPWWANEAAGHSHAKAWLNAGFETAQVDMAQQKLIFRRIRPGGLSESSRMFPPAPKDAARHPLFGALKGTFTVTCADQPSCDAADLAEMDAGIERTARLIEEGLKAK